jgi:type II secretory pathway predicted ATPase ExeA
MSYLEFFGLNSEPFSNAPVSRFFYNAPQHQQALTRLLYAASSMKGLAVLVGEIGAGKTTLARRLLDSLPEEEYEAALLVIIHSGITASWLLRRIALQLGVESPAQEKLALLSQLYQRLLQIYEQGRKAVVLIDEAQMLETRELMEEFRGLLNLEVPERKLISFVFFGLPEIEKNLKLDAPLAQRVAMRYRLEPFSSESTEAYVKHRLRLAGSPRMPFTPEAIAAVHRRSAGTPRVINTICDNALFEAFLARTPDIRGAVIEAIADNLGLETGASTPVEVVAPVVPPVAPPQPPAVMAGAAVVRQPVPAVSRREPVAVGPENEPAPPPPVVAPLRPHSSSSSLRPVAPSSSGSALRASAPPAPVSSGSVTAPGGSRPVALAPAPAPMPAPPSVPPAVAVAPTVPPAAVSAPAVAPQQPPPPPGDSVSEALASAVDGPLPAPAPSAPRSNVDLAEIDKYLEGLGKL